MSESNLAEKAPAAADQTPQTNADADEGLPGLQRLWGEMFGSILTFCQDMACPDSTRLPLADNQNAVERPREVAA